MGSLRVVGAAGAAAAAGAALMLIGRAEGSVVTIVMLLATARAAAVAMGSGHVSALGKQVWLVPAWVGIVAVGAARAGSPMLGDVRGANAVAGLAIARGETLMVVAVWLAAISCVAAIAASTDRAAVSREPTAAPGARLDLVTVGLQVFFAVSLFSGPQPQTVGDVAVWLFALIAAGGGVLLARRVLLPGTLQRLALGCALGATVVVVFGART